MARLNATLLLQGMGNNQATLIDEASGKEAVLTLDSDFLSGITQLANQIPDVAVAAGNTNQLGITVMGIDVTYDAVGQLLFWLGYFYALSGGPE